MINIIKNDVSITKKDFFIINILLVLSVFFVISTSNDDDLKKQIIENKNKVVKDNSNSLGSSEEINNKPLPVENEVNTILTPETGVDLKESEENLFEKSILSESKGRNDIYLVKKNDSLSKIAKKYKISIQEIIYNNPKYSSNPNSLKIGEELYIPKL